MDNTIDDLGYEKIHDKSQGYEVDHIPDVTKLVVDKPVDKGASQIEPPLSLDAILQMRYHTGHTCPECATDFDKATHQIQALIVEALYDLHEYMGQFPDDLNLAVMYERIKLIESGE